VSRPHEVNSRQRKVTSCEFRPDLDDFSSAIENDMIFVLSQDQCPQAWNCFEEGQRWKPPFKVLMMMPPSGGLP